MDLESCINYIKEYSNIRGADASRYKHLGHGPCTTLTKSAKLPQRAVGDVLKKALIEICLKFHFETRITHEDFRGIGIQVSELMFADLQFDHSVQVVPGTTRIYSFFKPVNKQNNSEIGNLIKSKSVSNASSDVRTKVEIRKESRNVSTAQIDVQHGSVDQIEPLRDDNIDEIQPQVINNPPQLASHPDSTCEIQPARKEEVPHVFIDAATDSRRSEAEEDRGSEQETEIPNGWDRSVFMELPSEIQSELLAQQRRNSAQARPRSKRQRQQTSLVNHLGNNVVVQRDNQGTHVDKKNRGK